MGLNTIASLLVLVLCCVMTSTASGQRMPTQSAEKVAANFDEVKTSMGKWLLHAKYDAEYISFHDPISISESKTTALVSSRNIYIIDPVSGTRKLQDNITSYSEKMQTAYSTKYHNVEYFFLNRKAKIIQSWSPLINTTTGSLLIGSKKLSLAFDGMKSRALLDYTRPPTGVVSSEGLEKPGNAISFFVFNPLDSYAVLINRENFNIVEDEQEATLTYGNKTYVTSKRYNYAITSYIERKGNLKTETLYSDFRDMGNNFFLPWEITQTVYKNDTGKLIDRRIAKYSEIEFGPAVDLMEEVFKLEFPLGTQMDKDSMLRGLLMRK